MARRMLSGGRGRNGPQKPSQASSKPLTAKLGDVVELPEPEQPRERQPRVAKSIRAGGAPGRWLVIHSGWVELGPYSIDAARRVMRSIPRAKNPWMLNLDRFDSHNRFGVQFDRQGVNAYIERWQSGARHYQVWYVEKRTGVHRRMPMQDLLTAYYTFRRMREDKREFDKVFVLKVRGMKHSIVYPKKEAMAAIAEGVRENPTGKVLSGVVQITSDGVKGSPKSEHRLYRPVIRGPDGKVHRPRLYIPADSEIVTALDSLRDQREQVVQELLIGDSVPD